MRVNQTRMLIFVGLLSSIISGKASVNQRLGDGCIIYERSAQINTLAARNDSQLHALSETEFLCRAASNEIFITYDMLLKPLSLIADLSTLCDYDQDIKDYYSLNSDISSCYFSLALFLLNEISVISKDSIGTTRVGDAFQILYTIHRHHISAGITSTDGFNLFRHDGLFVWKSKVALFVIGESEGSAGGSEGSVLCTSTVKSEVASCKRSTSGRDRVSISKVLSKMKRQLLHSWGDKSLWVDLTLYIGYQESNSGKAITEDRRQVDCDERLEGPLSSLSDVLTAAKCFEFSYNPSYSNDETVAVMQNLLINEAYNAGVEYFFFPDWAASVVFNEGWLMRSITALSKSIIAPNVGVVVQGVIGTMKEMVFVAFHRNHVSLFRAFKEREVEGNGQQSTANKEVPSQLSVAAPSLSHRMNVLSMIEAYLYYGAVFCPLPSFFEISFEEYDIDGGVGAPETSLAITVDDLYQYVARVEDIRVSIALWMKREYPMLGVTWSEDMMAYKSGDLFHDLYCSVGREATSSSRGFNPCHKSKEIGEIDTDIHYEAIFKDSPPAKIAFITAIYGGYEKSVKQFVRQSIPADFICFTDDPSLPPNGWIIDSTPYHDQISHQGNDLTRMSPNSLHSNRHPFNIAKFYKTSFRYIPRLKGYDAIVWLDGTIGIIDPGVSEYVLDLISRKENLIVFEHHRRGFLSEEVDMSMSNGRYNTTLLNGIEQPLQDVQMQYNQYIADGYIEKNTDILEQSSSRSWWDSKYSQRTEYGVFVTCFLAMDMRSAVTHRILDLWYSEILDHTTQDQVSFPYVSQMLNIHPYPLPDGIVKGDSHMSTIFLKHGHGM